MTRKTTSNKMKKSIDRKAAHSCKKVHHRLIFVRNHYLDSSEDESSMDKNIEPTKFDKIYQKNNSTNSDSTCEVLHFDDDQNQSPCSNQTVLPGVTYSSIEIIRAPDKSSSFSPLPSFNNEDSSTIILSSDCSNENDHINFSNLTVQEILKENDRQKKEIEYYKSEWMPKPTGLAAQVFCQFTQTDAISPTKSIKKESKRKQKMKQICRRLKRNISQIKKCKHTTDITKTCRSITKCLYPDLHVQASMKLSKMSEDQKSDIRECSKLLHPDQRHIKTFLLNNAIGNVFASEKHKE
ncbi:hypothetical protein I4U23_016133 [Adineta vaga]|nr:hypothetical protein I4U23_016133 [Adineta vaga]